MLASSVEPTVPPLFEPPPQTEAYAAFAKELAERERKLHEYVDQKFDELVEGARTRVGEYLLAAQRAARTSRRPRTSCCWPTATI